MPPLGIVGEIDEANDAYYIWTHKKFDLGYNGNQIVDVNLTSESRQKLELGAKIKFTYEVNWKKSGVKFEDRFDKYLDPNFFQHRVSARISSFNLYHFFFSVGYPFLFSFISFFACSPFLLFFL